MGFSILDISDDLIVKLFGENADFYSSNKIGIFVGRCSPLHNGHQYIIEHMLQKYESQHLICLGSVNEPVSDRNIFNYKFRHNCIKQLYPDAKVIGIPDFPNNNKLWFFNLYNLINLIFKCNVTVPMTHERKGVKGDTDLVFHGGSESDIWYAVNENHFYEVFNRDNKFVDSHYISSSLIKEKLKNKESISDMVHPSIEDSIVTEYNKVVQ